ncbi:MAG: M1 family peptidase [Bacteroidetes bacterium]|nr:MAG: M1 family peptidase [Bacteroidota bacterium]TAG91636.1 MAG: M1 family peptidase [Bacteroidota bacterium]
MRIQFIFYIFIGIFFCLIPNNLSAQKTKKGKYTRQDSLRGTLNKDRSCYDVLYYDLEIKVEPEKKYISGKNKITYKVVNDFSRLQIDLFANLNIESITQNNKPLKFVREGNATFVDFPNVQKKDNKESIEIKYEGTPRLAVNPPWDGGFSWRKDKKGKDWVGLSCEGLGASVWFPNKDHLSDEPDSMRVVAEVPTGLMCVANGNLKQRKETKNGFTSFDWRISYPINNYNVTLNIADYTQFSDVYTSADGQKLDLDYYVLPENLEKAKKHFQQVKPMLACYENLFGKYPFWKDGYALVETPYLGMEHQGAIAYGNRYMNGYLGSDLTNSGEGNKFDYIIIHETGHEYWGNSVSCQDHAEMWIHESFCTYAEGLYVECMRGKEAGYVYQGGYFNNPSNQSPIIGDLGVNGEGSGDMYPKGAAFLHTLRNVVNDDILWFKTIKDLAENFKYKTTNTEEIVKFMNTSLKKDYTPLFNQYLRFAKIPVLQYRKKGRFLECRWKVDVKNFEMPIKIKNIKNEFEWIVPNQDWKKMSIRIENDIEVLPLSFYVNVEKID